MRLVWLAWALAVSLIAVESPAPATRGDPASTQGILISTGTAADTGNGVATGSVKGPLGADEAIVLVHNERSFWIAVDRELQSGSFGLTEADLADANPGSTEGPA